MLESAIYDFNEQSEYLEDVDESETFNLLVNVQGHSKKINVNIDSSPNKIAAKAIRELGVEKEF